MPSDIIKKILPAIALHESLWILYVSVTQYLERKLYTIVKVQHLLLIGLSLPKSCLACTSLLNNVNCSEEHLNMGHQTMRLPVITGFHHSLWHIYHGSIHLIFLLCIGDPTIKDTDF